MSSTPSQEDVKDYIRRFESGAEDRVLAQTGDGILPGLDEKECTTIPIMYKGELHYFAGCSGGGSRTFFHLIPESKIFSTEENRVVNIGPEYNEENMLAFQQLLCNPWIVVPDGADLTL